MKLFRAIAGLALALGLIAPAAANVFILQSPTAQTAAPPSIAGTGDTVAYVAGSSAVQLENAITIACSCTVLTSATVVISAGQFTGDTLSAAPLAGLTASFSSPTLTISGTASIGAYVSVLNSATYASSNADPTNGGSNPTRTITWKVLNGSTASNQPTTTVNVSTPTATPTLANAGSTVSFTSGGSPVVIESGITTACSCSNLTGATVTISSGLLALDTLATSVGGTSITAAYDSSAGVLTLSGTDTKAHYQTVLQAVTYSSGLADPTNGGADTTRRISWVASNGASNSAAVTSTIITQNPSVPTIVVSAGNSISYTSGGVGVAVDNGLSVSCTCATLTGATLTLSSGFFNGDILAASTSLGITPVYNSVTGVMSLSGTTTVANYQTLMRTILYSSSAGDPSNGGHNATRTATWVASNGGNVSFPATTNINVFLTGQPTWAMTGAVVALNPSINQAWISGSGTGPLSSQITVTRATQETCHTGVGPTFVTYAAPNVACATGSGLAVWPAYTNYLTRSSDFSDSSSTGWVNYTGGAAGSSVAVVGNSVTDPTNITSQAAKVTLARTSTGNFAAVINNTINAPTGTYSGGIWVQADPSDPGSVGKSVQFAFLSSAGYYVRNLVLTANWQWFQFSSIGNLANGCVGASQTCQFQVGLTNQPGAGTANSTLAVTFDVWGGELNGGVYAYPTVATAAAPVAVQADNIAVTSASALETALTGAASSVIMNSTLGIQGTASTLLDSNGTTWLGQNLTNFLTTAIGSTVSTGNPGLWNSPNVFGIARDGTGRTMALNGGVIVKDTQATSIATPLSLGSTAGTSKFFDGYLGILNAFNVRVADSAIGVTGSGTSYYFAAAGNDSNACTISLPCQSITKANTIGIVTNDHMHFNGGNTFIGCLRETGGVNWNATRAQPATIDSYGTGQATLTGNCTAGNAKVGIINLTSTDGVIINNLNFVGDTAGNADRGVSISNCDQASAHGNITVENSNFTGIHSGPASNNDFGADIFFDPSCNNGNQNIDHITLLNNSAVGASPSSTDAPFTTGYNYGSPFDMQFDMVQGNLCANLGGNNSGVPGEEGSCMLFQGTAGIGSTKSTASGLPGFIAQFNVIHDDLFNKTQCGDAFSIWNNGGTDNTILRMNESYNNIKNVNSGCDGGSWDIDAGTGKTNTNNLIERNYSHGNWGPCAIIFGQNQNNTIRWNICDGDSNGFNNAVFSWTSGSNSMGTSYIYNNVFVQAPSAGPSYMIASTGCPSAGSLFANNVMIDQSNRSQNNLIYLQGGGGVACTLGSTGLTLANNDWWITHASPQWWCRSGGTTATTTYAACAANMQETGGFGVNPQFVNPLQGTICTSTAGGSGPNNVGGGCPAGYKLAGGSPMHAPAGAVLTSAPFNLPINNGGGTSNPTNGQGTLDYFGLTLPCPTTGGYPIGASC